MRALRISSISGKARGVLAAGILLGLGLMWTAWTLYHRKPAPNPLLLTPNLALAVVHSQSLYFNGAARPWLLNTRPDLLIEADKSERSERTRNLAQAVQSSKLFRRLDREYRFDTLLFIGDPSQYHPLLEHLLDTKDWTLTYLDHTSLIFKRGQVTPWQPADLKPIRARFSLRADEATFLGLCATKLLALRLAPGAKELLNQGAALDPESLEVLGALANYHINRGEWNLALKHAKHALTIDPEFRPALASESQIFYSTKRFEEALAASKKLIQTTPDDPNLLFYHAKIAHQRHAYGDEIVALNRLIALGTEGGRPVSGYQIYLGQAYASKGDAQPAIDEFTKALKDSELSDEQRDFAQGLLAQIKSRAPR